MIQDDFKTRLKHHKLNKYKVKKILEILKPHGGLKQHVIIQRSKERQWQLKPYLIILEELQYIGFDNKLKVYYIRQEGLTLLKRIQKK